MAETPWAAMMRTAVGLGVAPEAFWRLSLKEWRMLTSTPAGVGSIGRGQMDAMMRAWPDRSDISASSAHDGEGERTS